MSLGGLLLGLINIAIVVAVLVLVGALVAMFIKWFGYSVEPNVQKLYLLVVMLIGLYMLVALILGLPTIHVIGQHAAPFRSAAAAAQSSGAAADL